MSRRNGKGTSLLKIERWGLSSNKSRLGFIEWGFKLWGPASLYFSFFTNMLRYIVSYCSPRLIVIMHQIKGFSFQEKWFTLMYMLFTISYHIITNKVILTNEYLFLFFILLCFLHPL